MKVFVLNTILFTALISFSAIAQKPIIKSEEKIILQDNKPSNQVEVEIKDGNIFIDGKKVAPYSLNKNLKIIKKLYKVFDDGNIPDIELNIPKTINPQDAPIENKAMLGVSTELSKSNDGAVVSSINANTPAAKADIHEGDIITKVDKISITSPQDLVTAISNYKPGDKTTITFKRDGKEISKEVILQAREENSLGGIFGNPDGEDMMGNLQKMMRRFGDLNKISGDDNVQIFSNGIPTNNNLKLGAQVEERADGQGLRVVSVKEASTAAKAGIKPEDILISFNGNNINSIDDLSKAMANTKDKKEIAIEIMRNGKLQTLNMLIEKQLRKKDF